MQCIVCDKWSSLLLYSLSLPQFKLTVSPSNHHLLQFYNFKLPAKQQHCWKSYPFSLLFETVIKCTQISPRCLINFQCNCAPKRNLVRCCGDQSKCPLCSHFTYYLWTHSAERCRRFVIRISFNINLHSLYAQLIMCVIDTSDRKQHNKSEKNTVIQC